MKFSKKMLKTLLKVSIPILLFTSLTLRLVDNIEMHSDFVPTIFLGFGSISISIVLLWDIFRCRPFHYSPWLVCFACLSWLTANVLWIKDFYIKDWKSLALVGHTLKSLGWISFSYLPLDFILDWNSNFAHYTSNLGLFLILAGFLAEVPVIIIGSNYSWKVIVGRMSIISAMIGLILSMNQPVDVLEQEDEEDGEKEFSARSIELSRSIREYTQSLKVNELHNNEKSFENIR